MIIMNDANDRIQKAFPEIQPSAGHDYVDEIIGLLKIAHMHAKEAGDRCQQLHKDCEVYRGIFKRRDTFLRELLQKNLTGEDIRRALDDFINPPM